MRAHWLVLAMLIGTADHAWACSCPAASPCGAFDRTDAVFLGEVVDVRREALQLIARLEVSRVWKGTVDRVATVANQAGTSCSFDFRVGEQYLIYGMQNDATFRTNVCAGGGLLRAGTPEPDLPPVPGRVTGRVARYKEPFTDRENPTTPVPDVRVWIDTGAGVLEARSDTDGKFAVDGVPEGEHVVHADLGSAFTGSARITMHSSSDCPHALVISAPSGRLSGTLTSGDGTPIRDTEIQAIPIGHDWTKHDLGDVRTSRTNEEGAFEFREVKPDQYLLGVNVFEPPRVAQPFPPTYYPGVETREEATLVSVGHSSTPPRQARLSGSWLRSNAASRQRLTGVAHRREPHALGTDGWPFRRCRPPERRKISAMRGQSLVALCSAAVLGPMVLARAAPYNSASVTR